MGEVSTSVQSILDYTDLAVARRFGSLPIEERERMDALEQQLRDLIKGARQAPRNIGGRRAPSADPKDAQAARRQEPKALSAADKKKLNEIDASDIATSEYTAPRVPLFLADYYSADLVVASPDETGTPKAAVQADGSAPELRPEVRVLFGLGAAPPVRAPRAEVPRATRHATAEVAAPIVTPVVRREGTADVPAQPKIRPSRRDTADLSASSSGAPRAPTRDLTSDLGDLTPGRPPTGDLAGRTGSGSRAQGRRAANIHMAAGGLRRGHVDTFEPATDVVLLVEEGKGESEISLLDVLAIAFGPAAGQPPVPPSGTRAVVKLVNGRQVSGLTSDYQEGATALTLAPEERRGSIEFIWIPAAAVQEIHLG